MVLFLGVPQRTLIQFVRRALMAEWQLLLPSGAARVLRAVDPAAGDWHGFLRALTGITPVVQATPEMTAQLGSVCEQLLTPQSYFGKARLSPRFHSALAQSLCQWSLYGLTPELLEQGAQLVAREYAAVAELDDEELQAEWDRKTAELVQLWRAWQLALKRAGLPEPISAWRTLLNALESLNSVPPVLLAGFTELSTLELEVLRILDGKTQVALALLHDPEQPEKYAPTHRIRQQLARWGIEVLEQDLRQDARCTIGGLDNPVQASHGLTVRATSGLDSPVQASHGLTVRATILDAPNPFCEVEAVAREILRLQAAGVAFHEIALFARQPEAIVEAVSVLFARYGIPLQGEVALPLEQSWRVRWLMAGLRLIAGIGTGEQWLQWLAHPAHRLGVGAVRPLASGLRRHISASLWLDLALQRASNAELQRLLRELDSWRRMLPNQLPQVARQLALRLVAHSTPLERDTDLSEWVRLIDAYASEWQRRTPTQAIELLDSLVSGARYTMLLGESGVRLVPMEYADLAGVRVAFALQVLEGVLPRRHPDDPFLRETERHALNRALSDQRVCLPTRADFQRGEPMLFERILHAAHERLYLSYPRTQDDESDALPSLYLEELKARHPDAIQTRFFSLEQIAPEPSECLHPYDRSLCEPEGYVDPAPLIRRDELRTRIACLERKFSVTELETLTRCPFEHFARYILQLRPLQRGLSVRDVGTTTHNALCRAVRYPLQASRPYDWLERLIDDLQAMLEREAPDLPDWQVQVLHALVQRLLRRFGRREPLYRRQFGIVPHACEWAFGDTESDDDERVVSPDMRHNQAAPRPIAYPLSDGRTIQLRGVVDRIDLSADRQTALVIDYKLSSAPSKNEFVEGRAVQGLLYLHAVKTVLPNAQIALAYDRLKWARRTRFVPNLTPIARLLRRLEDEDADDCILLNTAQWRQAEQNLRRRLTEAIQGLCAARVEPRPGDYCRRCAFADLCRAARR
ncbi:MAG: PD-(D/E)XK nuclease family protein [Fimbriimonadales bacterium]|nr:PD-(D/E)XK nuclease family protein [Fimbriimonadales bacterium]